ncbi:MAG: diaminopimelate decarboxylase, partial [Jatrophihabitans sp.]|nr:diaminopimelate decarboxylase [Jatrophihabitans sp.]
MSRTAAHPAGPRHADGQSDGHGSSAPVDVNVIDPQIWPSSAARVDGVLHLGGLSVTALAAEHATPSLFLDEGDLRERAHAYASADVDAYYAGKAFLCTAVARWIDEEGLGLDVCTGGELAIALAADFPPARISLHGNNKSRAELQRAVDARVGHIIVDSFDEIDRLAVIAASAGVRQRVLVRVTVGVEAHTHEFIATAHEDQKFGFSLGSGDAAEAVRRVLALPSLELVGLHSHIGSQIFDTAGFEVAARRVVGLLAGLRDEHGIDLPELDLGGGLGIAYTPGDDPADLHEFAASLRTIVAYECGRQNLPVPR